MTAMEVARDITLTMIETRLLQLDDYTVDDEEDITKTNEANAKYITDFFNYIYNNIGK